MAINANIIAGLKTSSIDFPDPAEQQSKALQLKSLLMQQQAQQQSMADEQSNRQAFSQSGGDATAYLKALASSGNYKAYQAAVKSQADQAKSGADLANTQATTQKTQSELTNQEIARHRDQLSGVNDPQSAAQWVAAGYQNPVIGKIMQSMMPLEDAVKRIPTDPVLFNQWKQQAALGATKYIEQNKPTYQSRNLGGTTDTIALPGLGGPAQTVSSLRNTQSPDSIASNATTQRGQNMVDARAQQTIASGKVPSGYRANGDGSLSPIPGGPADNKTAKLTEDQGKATGWLIQATNAFDNMNNVVKTDAGATKPGFADAIVNFGGDAVGNSLRSPNRQKFVQSSSSLSESLLRAATGAGVNHDEAKQKIQELTPVFGDSKEVIDQKMQAIPLYIESLKVRAGPGSPLAQGVMAGKAPNSSMATPIKTADDYAKIPSGATYIDPNGKTRQKP